jgi:hypothetical protein
MKKEKEEKKIYVKPVLVKQGKLTEVITGLTRTL